MSHRRAQAGAATIEFALVFILFMSFLLAVVDFSRMLWTWNAAAEATRWGARTAVVCDRDATAVLSNMRMFLPQLTAANVQVAWHGSDGAVSGSCTASNCAGVNVSITGLDYQWIAPIGFGTFASAIRMPRFATYLPRESMGQDPDSPSLCTVAP